MQDQELKVQFNLTLKTGIKKIKLKNFEQEQNV